MSEPDNINTEQKVEKSAGDVGIIPSEAEPSVTVQPMSEPNITGESAVDKLALSMFVSGLRIFSDSIH